MRSTKNRKGTAFDDVFKSLLEKCRQLIIPVINEVFGTNYKMDEEVTLLPNEFHHISERGKTNLRITDSCVQIRNKIYHMECQSNPDVYMEIRIVEYDFFVALSNIDKCESGYVIKFPESVVVYLRHKKDTPDNFQICLELPGGERVTYKVPIIKVQNYERDELFDKNLLFFIPFYILKFEKQLNLINQNPKLLEGFISEYQSIYNRLLELKESNIIDANYLYNLVLLTKHLTIIVAGTAENIKKEVENMGGKVLRFELDDVWEAELDIGIKEGRLEGNKEGMLEGKCTKVIMQIQLKLKKNKEAPVIADELEEDISFVNKVIQIIKENESITEDEIYNKIK